MKILRIIGILIALFLVLVMLGGVFLSGEYDVVRTIEVSTTPDQVGYYVADLAHWPEWTPWMEMDPSIVLTLGEQTTGVGASQTWTSKDGSGELTFTHVDENGIEYDMAFISGEDHWPSKCSMTYTANGSGTTVAWSMRGSMEGFVGKYLALLMPGMLSSDFDKGLEKLKTRAEALPPLLEEQAPAESDEPEADA